MALQPVARRSVPEDVFQQIADGVLGGEFVAGEALPSERKLAETLGVSRPAVREAIKRLAASGLVTVRQGGATTVTDFRRESSLDLLPQLLVRNNTIVPKVVRSIAEARLHIGPAVAALAAERGGAGVAATLTAAMDQIAATHLTPDKQRRSNDYWDVVVDGADSIVYRLLYNSLRNTYEPALTTVSQIMFGEVHNDDGYRKLTAAIISGEPTAAATAARELLEPATTALLAMLHKLEE